MYASSAPVHFPVLGYENEISYREVVKASLHGGLRNAPDVRPPLIFPGRGLGLIHPLRPTLLDTGKAAAFGGLLDGGRRVASPRPRTGISRPALHQYACSNEGGGGREPG